MHTTLKLSHYPSLPFYITSLIQKLYKTNTIFSEHYFEVLNDSELLSMHVDEYVLSVEMKYTDRDQKLFANFSKTYVHCNNCTVFIENKNNIFSIDIVHSAPLQLDLALFKETQKNESFFKKIEKFVSTIKPTILTDEQKAESKERNIARLISWAEYMKIPAEIFPRTREEILSIETLNLSKCGLEFIPTQFKVLESLKELNLSFNKITTLLDANFLPPNLEKLWCPYNYIRELPDNMTKLVHLKELVMISNNLESLPDMSEMKNLNYIAMSQNRLSSEVIDKFTSQFKHEIQSVFNNQSNALPFDIEPLGEITLKQAVNLQNKFLKSNNKFEQQLLAASLNKKMNIDVYEEAFINEMQYWVAKKKNSEKVIGITGIYIEPSDDEESCWVGWFCVDEEYRGKGFGKALLKYTMKMAREYVFGDRLIGSRHVYLYTHNTKEFNVATAMYEKYGFKEYVPDKKIAKVAKYFRYDFV